jgi:hypothetical protein
MTAGRRLCPLEGFSTSDLRNHQVQHQVDGERWEG